jgi:hypothetical protein
MLSEGVMIIKNNKQEIIATCNLFSQTVDCKDEYLKMRVLGLIGNYLGNEINERENWKKIEEEQ